MDYNAHSMQGLEQDLLRLPSLAVVNAQAAARGGNSVQQSEASPVSPALMDQYAAMAEAHNYKKLVDSTKSFDLKSLIMKQDQFSLLVKRDAPANFDYTKWLSLNGIFLVDAKMVQATISTEHTRRNGLSAQVDTSGTKQIHTKEIGEHLQGSEMIKQAKEQYLMKKIASNIYKLAELQKAQAAKQFTTNNRDKMGRAERIGGKRGHIIELQELVNPVTTTQRLDVGNIVGRKVSSSAIQEKLKNTSSQSNPYSVRYGQKTMEMVASALIYEVNHGMSSLGLLKHTTTATTSSLGANSQRHHTTSMALPMSMPSSRFLESPQLIVNAGPDIPLKVPLDFSKLAISERVEKLKRKNLNRFVSAAKNLEILADQEKQDHMEKLKRKKKSMRTVEKNNTRDRKLAKDLLDDRKAKAQAAQTYRRALEMELETNAMEEYRKHIEEIKDKDKDKDKDKAKGKDRSPSKSTRSQSVGHEANEPKMGTVSGLPRRNETIVALPEPRRKIEKNEKRGERPILKVEKTMKNIETARSRKEWQSAAASPAPEFKMSKIRALEQPASDTVKGSLIKAKARHDDLLRRNRERYEQAAWTRDNVEKEKKGVAEEILQKHDKHTEQMKTHVLTKIEMTKAKQETNMLKKQDQIQNYQQVKRQHRENMLRLQVKHFGFDIKNKMKQVSLNHSQQKNVVLEQTTKHQVSINDAQHTYQIRPKGHWREMADMSDQVYGLQTTWARSKKYRSTSIS